MRIILITLIILGCALFGYSKVNSSKNENNAKPSHNNKIDPSNSEPSSNEDEASDKEGTNNQDAVRNSDQANNKDANTEESLIKKPTFSISEGDMVLGNKNAKVVMIEYFSPTCPHCVSFHKIIFPKIKEKYIDTQKISYIFREFVANKQDLEATILARCKGDVDNYVKFQEVILLTQEKWAYSKEYSDKLTQMGKLGSLTEEEYKKCLDDKYLMQIILNNRNLVASHPKFGGTPTFFINGDFFDKPYSFNNIAETLDLYLSKNSNEI